MSEWSSAYSHSYLFTVRLWLEDMGNAGNELRGEVRHVPSGSMRYFLEWSNLIAFMAEKVHELEALPKGGDGSPAHMDI